MFGEVPVTTKDTNLLPGSLVVPPESVTEFLHDHRDTTLECLSSDHLWGKWEHFYITIPDSIWRNINITVSMFQLAYRIYEYLVKIQIQLIPMPPLHVHLSP